MIEAEGEDIAKLILAGQYKDAKDRLSELNDGVIDNEGSTMYHEAVKRQDAKLLRWLLANYQLSVRADKPNHNGTTCFHIACAMGRTTCFYELWEKSHVHPTVWGKSVDNEGHTPLHIACLGGHNSVADEIVGKLKETVLYDVNNKQQTALHMAAAAGHRRCVILLAQYKKLLNAVDQFGATALHYAVNGGHLAIVQYLVEKSKADRSRVTKNGMNLLHSAVASGVLEVVKYIYGKTKNFIHEGKTSTGATVLHIAAGLGYEDILYYLLNKPNIYTLINYPDVNNWTAAHLAVLRNQPACLAILIGYDADVYEMKDKNGNSVYQIMRDNETPEMKKTFPYIFSQLEAENEIRQTESQSHHKSKSGSKNGLRLASVFEAQATSASPRRSVSSKARETSLSLSEVIRRNTKTNPLVYNAPISLRQRRFQKNNMALPKNGYTDRMPVMAYQLGITDDSDSDFHIDAIEDMPETPMKIIQKYNNFSHSTYTPPRSMEDLTKIESKDEELSALSGGDSLPINQSTAGDSLPVILDYTNMNDTEEAITIYFHNGELNTVKVKTLVREEVSPRFNREKGSPRSNLNESGQSVPEVPNKQALGGKIITASIEVHKNPTAEKTHASGTSTIEPPAYSFQPTMLDSPIDGTSMCPDVTDGNEQGVGSIVPNHSALLEQVEKSPVLQKSQEVMSEMRQSSGHISTSESVAEDAPSSPPGSHSSPIDAVINTLEELTTDNSREDYLSQVSSSPPSLPSTPLPPPDYRLLGSDDQLSTHGTTQQFARRFSNDYEFPVGVVLEPRAPSEADSPTDSPLPPSFTPPTPPHSPTPIPQPSTFEDPPFSFQTISNGDSADKSVEEGARETEYVSQKVDSIQSGEIPQTPDTMEREYLSFARSELNTSSEAVETAIKPVDDPVANQQADNTELHQTVEPRDGDRPNTDAKLLLRRLSSSASDMAETNFDLKSSTAYKLNYRAYKRKISTKHDTVTNLFEYDPIE